MGEGCSFQSLLLTTEQELNELKRGGKILEVNYPNHEVTQHYTVALSSDSAPLRPPKSGLNRSRQLSYIQGRNSPKSLKNQKFSTNKVFISGKRIRNNREQ